MSTIPSQHHMDVSQILHAMSHIRVRPILGLKDVRLKKLIDSMGDWAYYCAAACFKADTSRPYGYGLKCTFAERLL